MLIVDGHLDLAANMVELGRDISLALEELRAVELAGGEGLSSWGTCTVTVPALRSGNILLVFATIFVEPVREGRKPLSRRTIYTTPDEAHQLAVVQLDLYHRLAHESPDIMIVRTRADVAAVVDRANAGEEPLGLVILMEGAEPIRTPSEVTWWVERGVRIIGLSWGKTRYAGGNADPGPLTTEGAELLRAMDAEGVVLDTSHLAEEAFWAALDLFHGRVIASHSNPRVYVPGERQLSDNQIKAIIARDGIVGTVLYNAFLDPTWKEHRDKERVTLAVAARAIDHVCQLAGDARHAAIGSDLDGGLGREACPAEIDSIADLGLLAEPLAALGYGDDEIRAILGGNWLRLLEQSLPG